MHIGDLNWKRINPDIFGSMIQAVADDEERGALGMHYTSVPNILKVLNPLFLDDLRAQLEAAGDNKAKLLNLRKRIAAIRVFDPACGSGNFLVIAYIKLREIEAEIIRRRKDDDKKTWIKLTNFYGIEIKSFPAEIARLALLIAEFQCNVRFIGQIEARLDVLPLHDTGRIVNGNALRLDWLEVCPPPKSGEAIEHDLAGPIGKLALENEAEAETFICGNPPYLGSQWRNSSQQADMDLVFSKETKSYKDLDYVAAWYLKAAHYCERGDSEFALVATKTICQGIQVAMLWPLIFARALSISFCTSTVHMGNLAKAKTLALLASLLGVRRTSKKQAHLYEKRPIKSRNEHRAVFN
ncbi:MAG: class I SAM-dependent DNA methyltransferase [Hyphomicrobium sp.]|nr:class I SAM-dependent DNA methyltransferase [Hyphomicrobium sp.]